MSKRIVSAVALVGAASIITGCNVKQPSAGCQVQDADFASWQAVYTLKSATDASKCQQQWGEALGVFKYVDPEKESSNRLAIRPESAAALTEYTMDDEDHTVVARVENAAVATSIAAELADEPDANSGLCAATEFAPSTVQVEALMDGSRELAPAQTLTYAFENVAVYSAPRAPGTQLMGSLKYTDSLTGCDATYDMLALWPQTACDPEAFANPTDENAADRCGEGSGINPDFDAVCVAGIGPFDDDGARLGGCVPNASKGIPSFK
jgi:hypothetical protein